MKNAVYLLGMLTDLSLALDTQKDFKPLAESFKKVGASKSSDPLESRSIALNHFLRILMLLILAVATQLQVPAFFWQLIAQSAKGSL